MYKTLSSICFLWLIISCNAIDNTEDNLVCDLCDLSVEIVRDEIKNIDYIVEIIADVVEETCLKTGGEKAYKICKELCDDVEDIIECIAKDFSTNKICYELHLCEKVDKIN